MEHNISNWLPTSKKEFDKLGWDCPDVTLITGDAYIDHPSFGVAIIARILESKGLKVAVIPQPNWQDDLRDFKKLPPPKYFFGITAGNMDSMVNHYTANKRLRHNDAYTPGGRYGARPDYATIVYSNIIKKLFPETTVIIGGIEASMRRFSHYDYWSNTIKKSILIDSKADYLVYGMAEKVISDIADCYLNNNLQKIKTLKQIAYLSDKIDDTKYIVLHSFNKLLNDKKLYAENFKIIETESNKYEQNGFIQEYDEGYINVNPPYPPLSQDEIDNIYALPFNRLPHPRYKNKPPIPAYDMIKHSITSHRGCFGGCSFCTISMHQGRFISSRSKNSIIDEINKVTKLPDFKGYISDIGGPSANMYKMQAVNYDICKKCKRQSCIYPSICNNLNADHSSLNDLLESAKKQKNIKKIFIGSGIRYDLIYNQNNDKYRKSGYEYLKNVIIHHTSGRLKVAPEHSSEKILKLIRKPSFELFEKLVKDFNFITKSNKLKYQIIPYLISNHPDSTVEDMAELIIKLKKLKIYPEQVQSFTPTPMTLSTTMFYTGINPYTKKNVYINNNKIENQLQQKMLLWYKPGNMKEIIKDLKKLKKSNIINLILNA
ncbi:MAG: YgiQ family radical SAM protein [Marinilabiliales bacterium]